VLEKTKNKLKDSIHIDKCVIIYSGVLQEMRSSCGVAISFNQKGKKNPSYIWVKEKLMLLRCNIRVDKGYLRISGLYDPKIVQKKSQRNFIISYKKQLILLTRNTILFRWDLNTVM
jgi:hypothetical protein